MPLFHTNALAYSVLATLWSGGTIVLMPRFSSSRFWDIATRNACTWTTFVGFTLQALRDLPSPKRHSFEFWAGLGDVAYARERWGVKTLGWYGMTETVSQTICYSRDFEGDEMSMGTPVPEYEISIRGDDGAEVAFQDAGHLWVRGVPGLSLFSEYLNDAHATAECFDADGWFDTGDLVTPMQDGQIFFTSRAKDMLKIGGENVAAAEIENVIAEVPGVAEVAVVGKPDPTYDEVPVACVVALHPSEELEGQIFDACQKRLSKFKRPKEIVFLDQLPRGTLEKVLKRELRQKISQLQDLPEPQNSRGN